MSDGGWIPAYRRMFEPGHWLAPTGHDPASRLHAWLDLCQMATHKPRKVRHLSLDRGQIIVSMRTLAKRWRWRLTSVHRFISELKVCTALCTVNETPEGTIYQIVNYDTYAVGEKPDGTPNGTQVRTQAEQEQEGKKSRKKKTSPVDEVFEQAIQAYPDRQGGKPRTAALKEWTARVREGADRTAMLAGVERYWKYVEATGNMGGQYVKAPATFFGPDKFWTLPWNANGNGNGNGNGKNHAPAKMHRLRPDPT